MGEIGAVGRIQKFISVFSQKFLNFRKYVLNKMINGRYRKQFRKYMLNFSQKLLSACYSNHPQSRNNRREVWIRCIKLLAHEANKCMKLLVHEANKCMKLIA